MLHDPLRATWTAVDTPTTTKMAQAATLNNATSSSAISALADLNERSFKAPRSAFVGGGEENMA
jgi:hypothetical protein